jgi:predicted RNase H-like nuclease
MITTKYTTAIAILLLAGAYPANASSCSVESGKSISIIHSSFNGSAEGPEIRVSAAGALAVRLIPADGTELDIRSVRIKYSFFDITRKVADHVGGISATMDVAGDLLPVGKHKISIKVRDSAGHSARIKLTLAVTESSQSSCPATLTAASRTAQLSGARS